MAEPLTREDIKRICKEARKQDRIPDLSRANLYGADLSGANFYGADLSGANLSRATLYRASFSGADLYGANLSGANLRGADLYGANLSRANLRGADLSGANLSGANLRGADLSGATLYGVNLRGANLSRANLYGANLRGVNIEETELPHFQIPDGTLIAWGKKAGKLVKYEIPAAAKRTGCLINRKCRVEYALVLEIEGGLTEITVNRHPYPPLTYRVGEIVRPDSYDPDPRVDCSHGIHVFMTRKEAEEWNL